MTTFWLGAAALGAAALAFLLVPLWRAKQGGGGWSVAGLVAAIAVIPLAGLIYSIVSTYDPTVAGVASDTEIALVRRLAERLEREPEDAEGWQLLGHSYVTLGEYGRARDAFLEAWSRTGTPSTSLKLGLGEALIWTDPDTITAQGGDLIEQVLAEEPMNQRALWWGGLVAAERGQGDIARTRWTTLLGFNPPAEVANLIRQQLALLPQQPGVPLPADGPVLTVVIEVDGALSTAAIGPAANVFLFARAPGGGPPVAGRRFAFAELPGSFTLSNADAILAGRSLADFAELAIVARIALTGDPVEQAGDLYGEATYRSGADSTIHLTIDSVVGAQ